MNQPQPESHSDSYRDRSLGLVIFGAVEILIGLLCAALIPLTLLAVAVSPMMDAGVVLPSLALYAAMAAIFFALGVGSIRARRWAQTLTLSLSWVWLITGVSTIVLSWWLLPGMWRELSASSGLDAGDAHFVVLGINLFLSFIYVLVPGAFVLFYRSPNVIATCRSRDPSPGWTGRCPQRLLALAVAYALGGLSIIAVPAYGFVFPFFGSVFSGLAGAAFWAGVLVLTGALAWGTCRRRPWAWWTAMVAGLTAGLSSALTFAVIDPNELFEIKGLLSEQRPLLESLWPASPWIHVTVQFVIWGSFVAYLMVVKTLFDPPLGRGETDD